jgi:hypothetical protein
MPCSFICDVKKLQNNKEWKSIKSLPLFYKRQLVLTRANFYKSAEDRPSIRFPLLDGM